MNVPISNETRRWLGLGLLGSAFFMVIRDVAIVSVALPSMVTGLSIATAGLWLLSRLPHDARYLHDVMPALAVSGLGIGLAFVALSIGALEGVNEPDAGLASGRVNATQQIGGALGVAILSAVALSASTPTVSSAADGSRRGPARDLPGAR